MAARDEIRKLVEMMIRNRNPSAARATLLAEKETVFGDECIPPQEKVEFVEVLREIEAEKFGTVTELDGELEVLEYLRGLPPRQYGDLLKERPFRRIWTMEAMVKQARRARNAKL